MQMNLTSQDLTSAAKREQRLQPASEPRAKKAVAAVGGVASTLRASTVTPRDVILKACTFSP